MRLFVSELQYMFYIANAHMQSSLAILPYNVMCFAIVSFIAPCLTIFLNLMYIQDTIFSQCVFNII